jgi:hypothetical protein
LLNAARGHCELKESPPLLLLFKGYFRRRIPYKSIVYLINYIYILSN